MDDHSHNHSGITAWNIALIAALAAAAWLLWHFLAIIAVSFVATYAFTPIYRHLVRWFGGNKSAAAAVTVIASLFVILIPLLIVGGLVVLQTTRLITSVQHSFAAGNVNLHDLINNGVLTVNRTVGHFTGNSTTITYTQTIDAAKNTVTNVGFFMLHVLGRTVQNIPRFITNLFLYAFITGSLLVYKDKFMEGVANLNPMGTDLTRLYFNKMRAMTKAMLLGQLVTAFIQALESAVVFALVGYTRYFFIMLPIFFFLSIIPLGAGILTIPLGVVMVVTGNVVGGIIVIANHIIVIGTIDNFIRPKFISREAYLPTALTLLSVFAGLARFGFFGIIYGPIIMILVITTIQVYLESRGLPVLFAPSPRKRHHRHLARWRTHSR